MTATLEPTQNAAPLNMDEVRVDPAWALRIPPSLAVRRAVLPFASLDGHVYVACLDANDANTMQTVQRAVEMPIRPTLAEPESLRRALQRIFGDGKSAVAANPIRGRVDARATLEADSKDATGLCDELLHASIVRQASDVHIDPYEEYVQVRFRVDGILEPYRRLPPTVQNALISRFKVLSSMDIAEKRAPQDGRFTHRFGPTGQAIDVRVATLPTKYGERMTLRLLALQTTALTLERLGMSPHDLGCFEELINKPHGMILLTGTGPTGSGKSTTLYRGATQVDRAGAMEHRHDRRPDRIRDRRRGAGRGRLGGQGELWQSAAECVAARSRHRDDRRDPRSRDGRRRNQSIAYRSPRVEHVAHELGGECDHAAHRHGRRSVSDRGHRAAGRRSTVGAATVPTLPKGKGVDPGEAIALGRPESAGHTVYEPGGCLYCANRATSVGLGCSSCCRSTRRWLVAWPRGPTRPS